MAPTRRRSWSSRSGSLLHNREPWLNFMIERPTYGRRRMASKITRLNVFIASPGGLAEERKAFREVIYEYNEAESIPRGVLFQPVGWEDTLGAVGRPQTIINEDVRSSDYFLLLLWDRWGSPPATKCRHQQKRFCLTFVVSSVSLKTTINHAFSTI